MKSRWEHLRSEAIVLRKNGDSIGNIERLLNIPRSTLSGWFKDISLSEEQKRILTARSENGLIEARIKASNWHQEEKAKRIARIKVSVESMLSTIDSQNPELLEIVLAVLYLGEGSKKNLQTAMGASDPVMIRFFVYCLQKLYDVPIEKIRCELHLRYDQDPEAMKKYWAHQLQLPVENFRKPSFDKRTVGKPTYPDYPGVCLVNCGRVEIQRRLMYIAKGFCVQASHGHRRD